MCHNGCFKLTVETFEHAIRLGVVARCAVSYYPNWLHKPSHNFDSNWAALSVVIVAGVPNRDIHPLKKASATVSALISTSGIDSGQRVKRSTQVSRYLKPSAYGKGPTISICIGLLWRDILAVWQPLQERHHLAMYIFIPCQTNLVFNQRFCSSMRWMT